MSRETLLPNSDWERKELLAEAITELYRAGLVTAMGGNLSMRSASREDALWITPSQIFKGGLKAEQMILIDLDGKRIEAEGSGPGRPSVESVYHAGIMKMRPEVQAVVHTHAPLATAFAMCDMEMLPITSEAVLLMEMPTIPWALGGSWELAKYILEYIGKSQVKGAFLRNHGLVTIGATLREAVDMTYAVEHTVKILLACKQIGNPPSVLSAEGIQQVLKQAEELGAL